MNNVSISPTLSIVVCTLNRASLLRLAVESALAQDASPKSYEVIVVDNGSTDNTREVVEQIASGQKNIRYIFEETQGLSNARNRGWKEALGDYIIYIDDECLLPPGYLETAFTIIIDHNPDIFGGVIKAYYDFKKPHWVKEEYFSDFLDRKKGVLSKDEYVYGGNMGIRRELLISLGGFNINLGMKGNQLAFAEEVEFQQRALASIPNLEIYFDPNLWLYHHVRKEKVDLKWLLGWYFLMGKKGLERFNGIQDYDRLPPLRKLTWIAKIFAGILYRVIRICVRIPILILGRSNKYKYWQQYLVERIYGIEVNKIGVYWGELEHVFRSQMVKDKQGQA